MLNKPPQAKKGTEIKREEGGPPQGAELETQTVAILARIDQESSHSVDSQGNGKRLRMKANEDRVALTDLESGGRKK